MAKWLTPLNKEFTYLLREKDFLGNSVALLFFGSLVILDLARCYIWLFTLYINIKIGKIVVKC